MHHSKDKKGQPKRSDTGKMLRYTVRKIFWLINYSLSFSKKDTGKEIGIKILGCIVILQGTFLLFFMASSLLEIMLLNPFLILGFFVLMGAFVFNFQRKSKKENKIVEKEHLK